MRRAVLFHGGNSRLMSKIRMLAFKRQLGKKQAI